MPICSAFLIAFFNQLSGINAILYFAPRIFEMTGLGAKAALLQSVGIGVTNLVFTFVGLWLIDRLGRRTLLYIGSFGYIVSLGLTAWAFFTQHYAIVPACIFAFIAAHAIGQGAVIWVFISEIFPNRHRAEGQALGSFTHWIFAALLTTFFPTMVTAFAPGYVFLFFCGMMVLQLIWVEDHGARDQGRAARGDAEAPRSGVGASPAVARSRPAPAASMDGGQGPLVVGWRHAPLHGLSERSGALCTLLPDVWRANRRVLQPDARSGDTIRRWSACGPGG